MSSRSHALVEGIGEYVRELGRRSEDEVLRRLRERTLEMPHGGMQISPEQGAFMQLLVAATGVVQAIEVGTFTGYSSICIARGLPSDGRLVCCDTSAEWTAVAREAWREAGLEEKIELELRPASETLARLTAEGESDSFDFAFVDADKAGYPGYYDALMRLVRPGGLIAFDNAFMGGSVVTREEGSSGAIIAELTERIYADDRAEASILPIGDGLLLVRRR